MGNQKYVLKAFKINILFFPKRQQKVSDSIQENNINGALDIVFQKKVHSIPVYPPPLC